MKKILMSLFPLGLLAVIGFWALDCAGAPPGNMFRDASGLLLAFGRLAGILAAAGILAQLLLVSRAKWLEPLFGLDRLTKAHHVMGLAIPLALVSHPVLITLHHARQADLPFLAQYKAVLGWEDAPAALAGAFLVIIAVIMSLPAVRRRLNYEIWHTSHLFLYAGLGLAVGHQLELGGDINGNPYFAWTWYALYLFALANLAWGRVLNPLRLYRRHRFVVNKILPETTEVESIWITGREMASLPAQAGQFALLRFWAPGFKAQAHPFSISKAPDGRRLRFTIKKLGDFTTRVHHSLRPGAPVLIDGPHGVFTEKKCLGDKALLIAGGIGITPIRSLAERLQAAGKHSVLLYSNCAQKDIVFRQELAELERNGGFSAHHVLSAEPDWQGEKGYVDAGLIKRLVPDFAERDAFLCGPPPMTSSVKAALLGLGVAESRIHFEIFAL
ncbi:MAG: ferredoxin reductase family protein [Elusimicrobia bacterium]|nr:ferredoxin reductase family protein [Elusimicrobiota bacterium]